MVRKVLRIPKESLSDKKIMQVWHSMDLDGNGQIDANEFLDYQRRR